MFLLATMKHLSWYICDNYLYLRAFKFYMMNAPPADLRSQIDLLCKHCDQTADLTIFIFENSDWFFDTLCYI